MRVLGRKGDGDGGLDGRRRQLKVPRRASVPVRPGERSTFLRRNLACPGPAFHKAAQLRMFGEPEDGVVASVAEDVEGGLQSCGIGDFIFKGVPCLFWSERRRRRGGVGWRGEG